MQFIFVHEVAGAQGRLRVRTSSGLSRRSAKDIADRLGAVPGLLHVEVNARTGSVLMHYADANSRRAALGALGNPATSACVPFSRLGGSGGRHGLQHAEASTTSATALSATASASACVPAKPGIGPLVRYLLLRPLLPMAARMISVFMAALPYFRRGVQAVTQGKCNVDVLDATAIGISLLRRDFRTASLLTVLLGLGETLESWTRQKSRESLAQSLALDIDTVWVRRGDVEQRVSLNALDADDLVLARAGSAIAVDGVVVEGEAVVNQASMTGEALGILRGPGLSVYAGTVVEEGELLIRPTGTGDDTRLQKIINFIEESQSLKAQVESRAMRMADMAVPFTFLLAGLVWLVTRNPARAASVLLVDYSCALRLATPLAVLAAMREGAARGVLVKGGAFLEALAEADTVVFDKTGTLTSARPRVAEVIPAPGMSRCEVLRLAACLEEHFPHPVARAVVRQAEEEQLNHQEEHTEVEYVVAHGIASRLRGERVLLGSRHYVHHDEQVPVQQPLSQEVARLSDLGHSLLYLAVNGKLVGLIAIEDYLREETPQVLGGLRNAGIRRMVMLTGDDERTAAAVARRLGIKEYRAGVLPVDKAEIVRELQSAGHKVIMVGDGINDAPALSAAEVGVTLRDGTDLAREVADVVLTDSRLDALLTARTLGQNTLRRIHRNFLTNMSLNSLFLGGGLLGALTPGVAAVLHNVTTVGVTLNAMRPVLPPLPATEKEHA